MAEQPTTSIADLEALITEIDYLKAELPPESAKYTVGCWQFEDKEKVLAWIGDILDRNPTLSIWGTLVDLDGVQKLAGLTLNGQYSYAHARLLSVASAALDQLRSWASQITAAHEEMVIEGATDGNVHS